MGGPQKTLRDGDATTENTQPSQNGGRRDEERRESIEGEGGKTAYQIFHGAWMIISVYFRVLEMSGYMQQNSRN